MIVDIVDKYCTDDNNPIKNLRLNFVSKTNIFNFFGDVCRKTKANDLEKTLV